MLWILSADITAIDFSQDAKSCAALENILSAVFCGYHLLKINSNDIKALKKQASNFSARSKAVISRISSQNFQELPNIKYRVVIRKNCEHPIRKGDNEWEIPFDYFSNHATANRTIILAEDYIDAALYDIAAKHYVIKNKLKGFDVSSRPEAGGGSRTKNVLETIISRTEEACICVTDSDRYSPSDSLSTTAKDCRSSALISKWPAIHVATDARELENILPRKFVKEVIDKHQEEEWQTIDNLIKEYAPVFPYIDIKEGTHMQWIFNLPKGSPNRIFWDNQLQRIRAKSLLDQDCIDNQVCDLKGSEKCNCVISPGIGTKVAEKVRDYLLGQSLAKSSEKVDSDLDQEWLLIGQEVFEWCCAPKPIRC